MASGSAGDRGSPPWNPLTYATLFRDRGDWSPSDSPAPGRVRGFRAHVVRGEFRRVHRTVPNSRLVGTPFLLSHGHFPLCTHERGPECPLRAELIVRSIEQPYPFHTGRPTPRDLETRAHEFPDRLELVASGLPDGGLECEASCRERGDSRRS